MAQHEIAFRIAQMEPVATTVAECLAMGTYPGTHPLVVAVFGKACVPHIHEVVALVNIALCVVMAYVEATAYLACDVYSALGNTSLTREKAVAHLAFISSDKSLTREAGLHRCRVVGRCSFLSDVGNELHEQSQLVAVELHLLVVGSQPRWCDCRYCPSIYV